MNRLLNIFLFFTLIALIFSCQKNSNNQNVQTNCTVSKAMSTPVNFTILNGSGQFFPLTSPGGYIYVANVGISGIVIYRKSANEFLAFERNCTKDGCNNVKSIVWVQAGNGALKDSICGSTFSIFDGSIQTGPATIPLYQYHTNWDGNQLHVYN
jgi:Rieske Fe-S protein